MAPQNKENNGRAKRGQKSRRQQQEEEAEASSSAGEGDTPDDYRRRRDRNNQAVKRSRVKTKLRTQQTLERVHQLKTENEMLEEKIKMLSKELGFLKDLFLAHAGSAHGVNLDNVNLESLLRDDIKVEENRELANRIQSFKEGGRLLLDMDEGKPEYK